MPQGLANGAIGTLAPKWLDLRQGRMGVDCILQNRVETGVLAARQQSSGKGALRVSSPAPAPPLIGDGRDAIFMDGDVVEVAQAILHVLERGEKLLPALRRLFAGEEAAEQLRWVSHLLGLNAQLGTGAGIEPGEHFSLLRIFLKRRVNWSAAEISIATSPRSRTRSSCGLLHCPASSQRAISSVSARNRSDCTASCARARRRALLREIARET